MSNTYVSNTRETNLSLSDPPGWNQNTVGWLRFIILLSNDPAVFYHKVNLILLFFVHVASVCAFSEIELLFFLFLSFFFFAIAAIIILFVVIVVFVVVIVIFVVIIITLVALGIVFLGFLTIFLFTLLLSVLFSIRFGFLLSFLVSIFHRFWFNNLLLCTLFRWWFNKTFVVQTIGCLD